MNIRNLLGNANIIGPAATKATAVDRTIKSENTNQDRDGNGQEGYSRQKKKQKEPMTPEQFAKAIELLKQKSFVKDMNWVVLPVEEANVKYAWVQDQEGKSIRKIAEFDLWEIFDSSSEVPNKGQLLKKVA